MAKHSKRNRRRMHQAGMGGGFRMVRQVPVRFQRRLPQAAPLSPRGPVPAAGPGARGPDQRPRGRAGLCLVPVSTIYRWRKRFRPDDLTTLEPRSRRPHRTRRATWTAAQESAVLALRQQHPRMGKGPLRVLLAQQGHHLSASMIGRMLGSLRRRTLLREPHTVRVRRERPQRPYATRVPKDKRTPTEPGALVQLDTMHLRPLPGVERRQFTAIDVVSRCAVAEVRATASAGTATAFLDKLLARMPVPVQAIQVDGGSEFMAGLRDGLPGAGHRPLRVAAALPQAQRPGRAPQRYRPARVLGVLRGRPRLTCAPSRLARLGAPHKYGPTPPSPRVPNPRCLPFLPVVLTCIELGHALDTPQPLRDDEYRNM